jgi:hypothetical protein
VNASKPPADAPTPTIGNPALAGEDGVLGWGFREVAPVRPPERVSTFDLDAALCAAFSRESFSLRCGIFSGDSTKARGFCSYARNSIVLVELFTLLNS